MFMISGAAAGARKTRGRRLLRAGSALALVAAAAAAATAAGSAAVTTTAAAASCRHAAGLFHVVNHTEVVDGQGNRFVPYGITVPGLANWGHGWQRTLPADLRKIAATANDWCANTVRLQLSQDSLIGVHGNKFYPAYLKAIKQEVSLAEKDHLVVVLNDQTETAPPDIRSYQMGPTPGTEKFWKDLISVFGTTSQAKYVIFDLFNEPTFNSGTTEGQMWGLWHNGGTYRGAKYVGMQKLARDLRAADKRNLFWLESPDFAAGFSGMERYNARITGVTNIVYAFHHPAGGHNQTAWHNDFGYLVITGVAPVVDGEWTNYIPWEKANSECWTNAPAKVPVYLQYLAKYHIGMTAYQLARGLLVTSDSDLASPTTINSATWNKLKCGPTATPTNEGAGADILNWYRLHNE